MSIPNNTNGKEERDAPIVATSSVYARMSRRSYMIVLLEKELKETR
jgi:hypothetical protein